MSYMSLQVGSIQDKVFKSCRDQVYDENKSDLLSTVHTHRYMQKNGVDISRQQVQSAFYALTEKGFLEKEHYNIWRLK